VPFQNDTIWLENTDRNNPFGYLGASTQNRTALLVDNDSSCLIKTPALSIEDVLEKKTANIKIDIGTLANVDIKINLHGPGYEKLQSLVSLLPENDQKQLVLDNYIPFNSFELNHWEINVKSKDEPDIELKYQGVVNNFIKSYSGNIIVPILPTPIPRLKNPDKRKLPVRINYPVNKQDSLLYEVNFNEKYHVKIPAGDTVITKYGSYEIRFYENDNSIIALKKYILNRGEYDLDEYEDFYNFIKKIKNIERKNAIVLKPYN
jgi:hypothetical protein